jgi:GTP-binding protein
MRREKFVPDGGPNGGCGGRGGDVILVATAQYNTLFSHQKTRHYRADSGLNGSSSNKTGACGEPFFVEVPVGTVVKNKEGQVIADLAKEGEEWVAAKGGRAGRGNRVFVTATRKAPKFAEKGAPGEEGWIYLELRLIAEVGLVGYPNVGKSTLLRQISHAKPKIGSYPFTTLAPKLGVVVMGDSTFTVADLPGLIEGASDGKGLGDRFLRHAERTRIIVHMIDVSGWEGRDPVEDYTAIRKELIAHHPALAAKPEIVVANKMDVSGYEDNLKRLEESVDSKVYLISAAAGMQIDALKYAIWERLNELPGEVIRSQVVKVHKVEPIFTIVNTENYFRVEGSKIIRLVSMTDFENDEARLRLEHILSRLGLYKALAKDGCREGDVVIIGEFEFIFIPGRYL